MESLRRRLTDGEYIAEGLDKPARSIKGVFRVQDLFGETKGPIKWTITQPMSPGRACPFLDKASTCLNRL